MYEIINLYTTIYKILLLYLRVSLENQYHPTLNFQKITEFVKSLLDRPLIYSKRMRNI